MHRLKILTLLAFITAAGCFKGTGDMLITSDGTVIEGELQSISGGIAVFAGGTAEVSGNGRIWLVSGDTREGEIGFSAGEFTAGAGRFPAESVIVVIWDDQELERGTFNIAASGRWQDTGIHLEKGEMLNIRAEGTVVTETGMSTPAGQDRYSSSVALVPGATSGQLVFRTGDQGVPVAACENWTGESPGTGTLQLAVNVPSADSIEPAGSYIVSVAAGSNGRLPGAAAFYPASN